MCSRLRLSEVEFGPASDDLAAKFDDRGHLVRGIAVAIILVMVTTYVTAQLVAAGKAMQGFIGLDYRTGVGAVEASVIQAVRVVHPTAEELAAYSIDWTQHIGIEV